MAFKWAGAFQCLISVVEARVCLAIHRHSSSRSGAFNNAGLHLFCSTAKTWKAVWTAMAREARGLQNHQACLAVQLRSVSAGRLPHSLPLRRNISLSFWRQPGLVINCNSQTNAVVLQLLLHRFKFSRSFLLAFKAACYCSVSKLESVARCAALPILSSLQ